MAAGPIGSRPLERARGQARAAPQVRAARQVVCCVVLPLREARAVNLALVVG